MKGLPWQMQIKSIALSLLIIPLLINTASSQAMLQTGKEAPAFSLKDINGKETGLAQYSQKKAVVILFWATWSANSQKALKRFEDFYKKYKDKGIQIVAINANNQIIANEDLEAIKKLVKDLDITFPVLLDQGLKTFHGYETIALPSTIIVTEGKISYEMPGLPLVGTEDMLDYLLTLAGEQPRKKMEAKYKPRHDAIADSNLAKGFAIRNKPEKAYPLFIKAIEKDPKYMLPYVELAKLYKSEKKYTEAEETLRKAVSVEPENVAVITELGCLLLNTGRTKEALEMLTRAAKINSYTPSHYYLAYALGKNGQLTEALAAFEKALALNPYDEMIYTLRGETYENNKKPAEASADYRKALELKLKIKN